jgi:hypothetical protein
MLLWACPTGMLSGQAVAAVQQHTQCNHAHLPFVSAATHVPWPVCMLYMCLCVSGVWCGLAVQNLSLVRTVLTVP